MIYKISGKIVYVCEINSIICSFIVCIEEVFVKYNIYLVILIIIDLKEQVNEKLGRIKEEEIVKENKFKILKDIFFDFL